MGSWTRGQVLNEYYLYAVVAFFLMVPAVLGDPKRGLLRRLLGHPIIVWLGVISYGVYLWQLTWLNQLGPVEAVGGRDGATRSCGSSRDLAVRSPSAR